MCAGHVDEAKLFQIVCADSAVRDKIIRLCTLRVQSGTYDFSLATHEVLHFRVHWLMMHVPHHEIITMFSKYGEVIKCDFAPDRNVSGQLDMVRQCAIKLDDGVSVDDFPYYEFVKYEGKSYKVMITVKDRTSLCHKCGTAGHTRMA